MTDKEDEGSQAVIDRINAALPLLVENLNSGDLLPWKQGITLEDLTICRVPPTLVTGNAFDVAVLNAVHYEAGHKVDLDLLESRLLVIESEDEEDFLLADLCIKNKVDRTVWIASIEFDRAGQISKVLPS